MGVSTFVLAMINLNMARYLNISIVTWLVNRSRSETTKIGKKEKFVMWIAGLRGAMAYALAMESTKDPNF